MISSFFSPSVLSFPSFHGLVVWGWGLWTDRVFSLSPGLAQRTPNNNTNNHNYSLITITVESQLHSNYKYSVITITVQLQLQSNYKDLQIILLELFCSHDFKSVGNEIFEEVN